MGMKTKLQEYLDDGNILTNLSAERLFPRKPGATVSRRLRETSHCTVMTSIKGKTPYAVYLPFTKKGFAVENFIFETCKNGYIIYAIGNDKQHKITTIEGSLKDVEKWLRKNIRRKMEG